MPNKRDNEEERLNRIDRMIWDARIRKPAKASLERVKRVATDFVAAPKTIPRKKR